MTDFADRRSMAWRPELAAMSRCSACSSSKATSLSMCFFSVNIWQEEVRLVEDWRR